jgi:ZIP family zinc transporter
MGEAFAWGALGASALLIGAVVAYVFHPGRPFIAVLVALGTGLLIGSVSFELIDEALKTQTVALVALYTLVGAATFTVGDWIIARGGGQRLPQWPAFTPTAVG